MRLMYILRSPVATCGTGDVCSGGERLVHESVPPRSHSTTDPSTSQCAVCHRTCAKPCTVVDYAFKGILYLYTLLVAELVRSLGSGGCPAVFTIVLLFAVLACM